MSPPLSSSLVYDPMHNFAVPGGVGSTAPRSREATRDPGQRHLSGGSIRCRYPRGYYHAGRAPFPLGGPWHIAGASTGESRRIPRGGAVPLGTVPCRPTQHQGASVALHMRRTVRLRVLETAGGALSFLIQYPYDLYCGGKRSSPPREEGLEVAVVAAADVALVVVLDLP